MHRQLCTWCAVCFLGYKRWPSRKRQLKHYFKIAVATIFHIVGVVARNWQPWSNQWAMKDSRWMQILKSKPSFVPFEQNILQDMCVELTEYECQVLCDKFDPKKEGRWVWHHFRAFFATNLPRACCLLGPSRATIRHRSLFHNQAMFCAKQAL